MVKTTELFLLSTLPPVFVSNLLPHETPNLEHNTPLLPGFCPNVAEAGGVFQQVEDSG